MNPVEKTRNIEIVFIKDQKQLIQLFSKKKKSDYLLNINKIIKDKFDQEILIPNLIQSFLINYEIKKLIDKAVNIRNLKYNRILYLNSNLTSNLIMNTLNFLATSYPSIQFHPKLIDSEIEFENLSGIEILSIE